MITTLKHSQFLPISLEQAWDYFATPANLNEITPEDMSFKICSELPDKMYEGLFITYKVMPFLNIPLDWCTEITHIKEQVFFVDEQRVGPFSIWHHEHHFISMDGGVLMTDILSYKIGKSIFGYLAGKLFVHKKVRSIFEYRSNKLMTIFPKK